MGTFGPELSLCGRDYKDSNIIDFISLLLEKETKGRSIFPCILLSNMVFSSVFPQVFFACSRKCFPHCFAYLLLQFKSFPFTFTLYLKLWAGRITEQQKPKTTDPELTLPATSSNITDLREHKLPLQKYENASFMVQMSLPENEAKSIIS